MKPFVSYFSGFRWWSHIKSQNGEASLNLWASGLQNWGQLVSWIPCWREALPWVGALTLTLLAGHPVTWHPTPKVTWLKDRPAPPWNMGLVTRVLPRVFTWEHLKKPISWVVECIMPSRSKTFQNISEPSRPGRNNVFSGQNSFAVSLLWEPREAAVLGGESILLLLYGGFSLSQ